jgi:hypothetical protein
MRCGDLFDDDIKNITPEISAFRTFSAVLAVAAGIFGERNLCHGLESGLFAHE